MCMVSKSNVKYARFLRCTFETTINMLVCIVILPKQELKWETTRQRHFRLKFVYLLEFA